MRYLALALCSRPLKRFHERPSVDLPTGTLFSEDFGFFPILRTCPRVLQGYSKRIHCFWCSPCCANRRARAAEPPRARPYFRNTRDSKKHQFSPAVPGTSRHSPVRSAAAGPGTGPRGLIRATGGNLGFYPCPCVHDRPAELSFVAVS